MNTTDTPGGPGEQDLFPGGDGHPPFFRIPSLLATRGGTLLAFCEARNHAGGDHAENDILLRRSADNGSSWGPVQMIASDGRNSLNNPTVVQVRETGLVILMYQRYPCGFHTGVDKDNHLACVEPGYDGEHICRTFLQTSDDDGVTWSDRRDITRSVKRSAQVRSTLCGPGIGIQLRHGPWMGRIVIPFYEGGTPPNRAYCVYSDDGGETWSCGEAAENISEGGGNENQVVELSDGSILLNSRRSACGVPCRKKALSRDGGASWSGLVNAPELVDPACQASILRYSDPVADQPGKIIFSGPSDPEKRRLGMLRMSLDEGATWPMAKLIRKDGFFCYSCLTVLRGGEIGCLYERTDDDQKPIRITFAAFPPEWLTEE